MIDTRIMPPRLALKRGRRSRMQQRQVRPLIQGLEERIVPSYFPSTANGIHIFEDQLPNGMSSAMTQFVATHTDGTQKELLSQTNQFRAINPNFTVLHYQLGTGNSPYDYIINDQWSSDFSYVNKQESWFAHQSYSGEPQSPADLAQRPGGQQHRLGPGGHRQPRLATVHAQPGLPEHGGHRLERMVRRQLHIRHWRGRVRQSHSHALSGHQRRQSRVLARRRHLDRPTGQLGPDHRDRVRQLQRDERYELRVHPEPRRARHFLGAQLVRQHQRRPLHRRRVPGGLRRIHRHLQLDAVDEPRV